MAIGREVERDVLILTLEADFDYTLKLPPDRTFPPGTAVRLKLYPPGEKNTKSTIAVWDAQVAPTHARWVVESEQADLIPDRAHFRIYVSYPESPTREHPWFVGDVRRDQ
ncbi:LtfC-like domain-containing protein [Nocardia sp. IFM 10818]